MLDLNTLETRGQKIASFAEPLQGLEQCNEHLEVRGGLDCTRSLVKEWGRRRRASARRSPSRPCSQSRSSWPARCLRGEHVEHVGLVYLPSSKVAYFGYHWVLGFHRRLLWKRSPARFVIVSFEGKFPSNQQHFCHLPWVPFLFPRNAENPCC